MSNISENFCLSFFKADRYSFRESYVFNTENAPRPHFCIGLILSGAVSLLDCKSGDVCKIEEGEIIFVPMNSTYVARWEGNQDIEYISLHFVFDMPSVFSRQNGFRLSGVGVRDFEKMRESFELILNNYTAGGAEGLAALSRFYMILAEVLPSLECGERVIDHRVLAAIEYIEKNYKEDISVPTLAGSVNMSPSRFYPLFKRETGDTPTDYVNRVRIGRAIVMMYDKSLSVEDVSEAVGYNSSIYFRRVFKKLTGKTPKEYMKTSVEM